MFGFTYLPGEAGTQEVDPGAAENDPSGQEVQFEAPVTTPLTNTGENKPAEQVWHEDAPKNGALEPPGQAVHCVAGIAGAANCADRVAEIVFTSLAGSAVL